MMKSIICKMISKIDAVSVSNYLFYFFSSSYKARNQFPCFYDIFFWVSLQPHANFTIFLNFSFFFLLFLFTSSMQLLCLFPLSGLPFLSDTRLMQSIQIEPSMVLILQDSLGACRYTLMAQGFYNYIH